MLIRWFDVAIWQKWPALFPEDIGYVQAPNAFQAIEGVMSHSGLFSAAYATARTLDGSLVYRCWRIQQLAVDEVVLSRAGSGGVWMRWRECLAWHPLLSGATQFTPLFSLSGS